MHLFVTYKDKSHKILTKAKRKFYGRKTEILILFVIVCAFHMVWIVHNYLRYARIPEAQVQRTLSRDALSHGGRCESGHVTGFSPICGSTQCLRVLRIQKTDFPPRISDNSSGPNRGLLELHESRLIRHLTDMQWIHSIYGSVGHVGLDSLTSRYFDNVDIKLGERLFIDGHAQHKRSSTWYTFLDDMADRGIAYDGKDSAQKIYHLEADTELSKDNLLAMDIPAFRMFRVTKYQSINVALNTMENVACVIREGGIIVVENFRSASVKHTVKKFFKIHRHSAFVPLLVSEERLILCSLKYHARYMEYVRLNMAASQSLRVADTVYFGKDLKYYVPER